MEDSESMRAYIGGMTMLYILIGVAAGVLSGLFGIGGGVVIVPALLFVARMTPLTATGTSLGALLLPVGALGAWEYYRTGNLDIRAVVDARDRVVLRGVLRREARTACSRRYSSSEPSRSFSFLLPCGSGRRNSGLLATRSCSLFADGRSLPAAAISATSRRDG